MLEKIATLVRILIKPKINTICYISLGFLGLYLSLYQCILSTIAQKFSLNSTLMGFIISMHFIGSLIAPVVLGRLSDRIGKKVVAIISVLMFIIGLSIEYFFNKLFLITIGIFLNGGGFSVTESVLSGVLADLNKEQTNKVINLSQMFFSMGALLGPIYVLWITTFLRSWKASFLLLIIAFIVILIYIVNSDFEPRRNNAKIFTVKLKILELLKGKTIIFLALSMFVYVGIEEGVAFWTKTYFDNLYDIKQLGAYALSGYWGAMIVGRYIASKFEERYKLVLMIGLISSVLVSIIGPIFINRIVSFCFLISLGLSFSVIWPIIMSLAAKYYPHNTGTVFGIMMTSSAAGGIIIPFLMGVINVFIGIRITFFIIVIMVLLVIFFQIQVLKSPFASKIKTKLTE